MKYLNWFVATAALAAITAAAPVAATSFSPDQSDLWWVPTESGWGMQLVQRDTVIFSTLFVYDANTNPVWYSATLNYVSGTQSWTGQLFATQGPAFSTVPFNPALVTRAVVGTMTWTVTSLNSGHLQHSVNGANVVKDVVRQTLVLENFSGSYIGGSVVSSTGCTNPSGNGTVQAFIGQIIAQSGATIAISTQAGAVVCNYNGAYTQAGQMGGASGSYSCNNSDSGTFTLTEMQVNELSFSSRIATTSTTTACQSTGSFSGTRR